ncbi:homocysteine S-methyltransferase family protein [Hippea maritima]|uniref:Methionine synthase n=1 Tax=Hippea maritima (strain ATCC 700847 / DSM 10411 / MH2) TaxID=760142 RepID=F2LVY3_HIPMA|nr:homocysteine S-methyltransferase family protein [Hippea maritima]AEA33917.1 Methionine synthase [Hippea maritima DSM 10411]
MRNFREELGRKILILDGAMGTQLQEKGILKTGSCPDYLNVTHPKEIGEIHKTYLDAGADIIVTNTFGANPIKLEEFNLQDKVYQINYEAVRIAKEVVKDKGFVSLSIGPTGKFIEPVGEENFDYIKDIFKKQVRPAVDADVDLFSLETFMDIKELKAAIIAIREITDKPIIAMMTFAEDGRTILGTSPEVFAKTIEPMEVDVIGANCSVGPDLLNEFVKKMAQVTDKPLIIQPNAGIPRLVNGKTIFPVGAEEFASYANDFKEYAAIVAGCCGTGPEHIKLLAEKLKGKPVKKRTIQKATVLTSRSQMVEIGYSRPVVFIGERLNPTGKKHLKEQLKEGKTGLYRKEAIEQVEHGAMVLDINVGVPMIDEPTTMKKCVLAVESVVSVPLVIDSSNIEALEAGLKAADGKVLINSVNGSQESMEAILPLAKKYGAAILALLLDETGIPETAEDRLKILDKIVKNAKELGIKEEDIVADALALTIGSDKKRALETLRAIKLIKEKYGITTILGLSNVSFGLPNRKLINSSFMAMAIYNGLDSAIVNPYDELLWQIKYASDLIVDRDKDSSIYINNSSDITLKNKTTDNAKLELIKSPFDKGTLEDKLFMCVIEGNEEEIELLTKQALKNKEPLKISNEILIPALDAVGKLYDKGIYFLPQMIKSANAMKKAFNILKEIIKKKATKQKTGKTIVMATVKGDIHDIGKNIVSLLLETNGFEVVDLGKNVDDETILKAIEEYHADAVGLSALMTTTMINMKNVIDEIKMKGLNVKIMVGGAAVTEEFAKKIGADMYAKDAIEAVRLAKENV